MHSHIVVDRPLDFEVDITSTQILEGIGCIFCRFLDNFYVRLPAMNSNARFHDLKERLGDDSFEELLVASGLFVQRRARFANSAEDLLENLFALV